MPGSVLFSFYKTYTMLYANYLIKMENVQIKADL